MNISVPILAYIVHPILQYWYQNLKYYFLLLSSLYCLKYITLYWSTQLRKLYFILLECNICDNIMRASTPLCHMFCNIKNYSIYSTLGLSVCIHMYIYIICGMWMYYMSGYLYSYIIYNYISNVKYNVFNQSGETSIFTGRRVQYIGRL